MRWLQWTEVMTKCSKTLSRRLQPPPHGTGLRRSVGNCRTPRIPFPWDQPSGPDEQALSAIDSAREAIASGAYDYAIDVLAEVTASPAAVELLLSAAIEIGSLEAAGAFRSKYETLSEDDRARVAESAIWSAPLRTVLARSGGQGPPVTSWSEWIDRLIEDRDSLAANSIAELGSMEWDPAIPSTLEESEQLAARLLDVPDRCRDVLESAIPHILNFLERRPNGDPLRVPLDRALLEVLVYGESRTRVAREAVLRIIEGLLGAGINDEEYDEYVGFVELVWVRIRSPRNFDWMLDALNRASGLHMPTTRASCITCETGSR